VVCTAGCWLAGRSAPREQLRERRAMAASTDRFVMESAYPAEAILTQHDVIVR
jgi:hypothetical protein